MKEMDEGAKCNGRDKNERREGKGKEGRARTDAERGWERNVERKGRGGVGLKEMDERAKYDVRDKNEGREEKGKERRARTYIERDGKGTEEKKEEEKVCGWRMSSESLKIRNTSWKTRVENGKGKKG